MASVAVLMGVGALVGGCIGLTGVGGGSLMTPILLFLGIPAPIAIGTDLFYASFTKAGSALVHWRHQHVQKQVLLMLATGSIPASLVTAQALTRWPLHNTHLMTSTLAFMLALTGASLLFRRRIQQTIPGDAPQPVSATFSATRLWLTWLTGSILGVLVTLSSVGAGAVGVLLLTTLYPQLRLSRITGTDVAHAVLLTTTAGIGHWQAHHVNLSLLLTLCSTSLPAMYLGTRLGHHTPERILRPLLGSTLLLVSLRFAFF